MLRAILEVLKRPSSFLLEFIFLWLLCSLNSSSYQVASIKIKVIELLKTKSRGTTLWETNGKVCLAWIWEDINTQAAQLEKLFMFWVDLTRMMNFWTPLRSFPKSMSQHQSLLHDGSWFKQFNLSSQEFFLFFVPWIIEKWLFLGDMTKM